VRFEVLHPLAQDHARERKPNALSCVLRVVGGAGAALLTGDIEKAQEARLVADGTILESDILVVPHHGSKTSSTAAFLDAVRPKVAIIQAGYHNRFGHPVAAVLSRLAERHVLVHVTASCGAWQWRGGTDAGFGGHCQREVDRRYWHAGPDP
jgi:competence protein ComEC